MSPGGISGGPPAAPIVKAPAHPGATRTLKCRTVAQGRFSQLTYIRDLAPQSVTESQDDDLSSEAVAPNALEALLAAFGSCFSVGIHANAVAQGILVHSLELQMEADITIAPILGAGILVPKAIGIETIRVVVHMVADAPVEMVNALVRHALIWSPVANTLHNPVHLDVSLAPAVGLSL
jgi:uncharacterized OsmC-like protein